MNDKFRKIDFETWERKDNYKVFTEFMPRGIQMNANVDITDLIKEMKNGGTVEADGVLVYKDGKHIL